MKHIKLVAISFFVMFLIQLSLVDKGFGEDTEKSTVVVSESSIKHTVYLESFEIPELKFEITNYGPYDITIEKIILTNLLSEKNAFAFTDISIDKDDISVIMVDEKVSFDPLPVTIKTGEDKIFTLIVGEKINYFEEGIVSGKVSIVGTGFDTITKDVSIVYVVWPVVILFSVIIGILISMVVGYFIFRKEICEKFENSVKDDNKIIKHINEHISEINLYRQFFPKKDWCNIECDFERKETSLKESTDVTLNSEDVQWYESTYLFLQRKWLLFQLENTMFQDNPDNEKIPDIDEFTKSQTQKRISTEVKKFWQNNRNRKKSAYFGTVSLISSISAFFVTETFVGNYSYNIVLSMLTGFALYRAQDFQKIFKRD
ncbi:MAG: hypothetical protein OEL52_01125 [Nitrosopumilus sp.]|nr:hypothetical protein [Nitrosopumilus sp.]